MVRTTITFILSTFLLHAGYPADAEARDLVAAVGLIPPHSMMGEDGRPQGAFIEIVRAIDRVYTEGTISILLSSSARSFKNLETGKADFFFPYTPNPHDSMETLPFAYASEPIVQVAFVLYTNTDKPMPSMVSLEKHHIEILRGGAFLFTFKVAEIGSFRQGILKVATGRSDGFIAEQDATDIFIRTNKIKNIRRTRYFTVNSSVVIPKGPRGEEIDRIVSGALRKLKATGELQKITDTIHRPFSEWQPYEMDW